MNILAYNPGHDGAVAHLQGAQLLASVEVEKNSNYRHSGVSVHDFLIIFSELKEIPDVLCEGGWWPRDAQLSEQSPFAGYRGVSKSDAIVGRRRLMGKAVEYFPPPTNARIFFAHLECQVCPRALHVMR